MVLIRTRAVFLTEVFEGEMRLNLYVPASTLSRNGFESRT